MKEQIFPILFFSFLLAVFLGLAAYFIPWGNINWGKVEFAQSSTITVTGEAKGDQTNQIATFNATVAVSNDDKQTAIDEVNKTVNEMVAKIKEFGIADKDIKTESMSIYKNDPAYSQSGTWSVSNSVTIKLNDASKAQEMAGLLGQSGATSVYGPSFATDNTKDLDTQLLTLAITDAKKKAEEMAASSNRRLGKVINIIESGSDAGIYRYSAMGMGGGGGAELNPGTSTVYKTVTVVFELK
ncbi:SIMPL domain-containing protein [Candidatus Beckwithbacteria bacterium]|nr:SIMPL domain-containing protein [Candidatus Beckwithbacteria bacterium]